VISPILSFGGNPVAFVQNSNVGGATLVLLKWARSAVGRTLTAGVTSGSVNFTVTSGTLVATDVGAQISGTGIPAGDTIASVTSGTAGTLATAATTTASETLTVTTETPSTPGVPPTVAAGSFSACTAPCMTLLPFDQTTVGTDSNSSPFVDYATGTLYVGDDNGYLHKFTNVFTASGAPAETVGGAWPIEVNLTSSNLTGPVYNASAYSGTTVTPQVFVADQTGHLYGFNASSGALVGESNQLSGSGSTVGIADAPLVDGVANNVYASVGYDGNTATGADCDTTGCEGVFRFSVNSTSAGTNPGNLTIAAAPATICSTTSNNSTSWSVGTVCGVESTFGIGSTSFALYDGSFDQTYYTQATEGSGGNLWTCADYASTSGVKLMSSPISSTGFGTTGVIQVATNVIKPLTSGAATCSPVTEIYNTATSTDWIFLSVTANGNQTGTVCSGTPGACLYNFNINATPTAATAGIATAGGSSGIVIDNTSSAAGASQIYYSPLGSQACGTGGTGGCAVQAAQSAP
jgi:hypothetical protein